MGPWDVFLAASHVFYFPVVILSLLSPSPFGILDAAIWARMIFFSLRYHLGVAGVPMFGDPNSLQITDNVTVWTLILYGFLTWLPIHPIEMATTYVLVVIPFILAPSVIIDTWVMPLALIPGGIADMIICKLTLRLNFHPLDWTLVGAAVVIGTASMTTFFLEPYHLYHGIWHILSGIAGTFAFLAFRGYTIRAGISWTKRFAASRGWGPRPRRVKT